MEASTLTVRLFASLGVAMIVAAATGASSTQRFDPITVPPGGRVMDATSTVGDETLYLTLVEGKKYTIVSTSQRAGAWTEPVTASFSGWWRDLEEVFAPDGQSMIFASNRPVDNGDAPVSGFFSGKVQPERGGNL